MDQERCALVGGSCVAHLLHPKLAQPCVAHGVHLEFVFVGGICMRISSSPCELRGKHVMDLPPSKPLAHITRLLERDDDDGIW